MGFNCGYYLYWALTEGVNKISNQLFFHSGHVSRIKRRNIIPVELILEKE